MPPARRGRPATRRPAPGPVSPGPEPAPAPEPAPTNVLLRQLIETCIEQARDHPAGPRDDSNRPLKPRNPDLYYGNSHMKCYYFCQQCEDHFETAGAKGHKRVPFAAGFLKDRIFNRWQ